MNNHVSRWDFQQAIVSFSQCVDWFTRSVLRRKARRHFESMGRGERICIATSAGCYAGSQRRWLVTCAGETRMASKVEIRTAFDPSAEPAGNETQAIYVCTGSVTWQGNTAVIT